MHVTLCDFIVPWDTLSTTQKKSLNHRYQMGCECKVSRHHLLPGFSGPLDVQGPNLTQDTGDVWPPHE